MPLKTPGIDHIDICAFDPERSIQFYDAILGELGFTTLSSGTTTVFKNADLEIGIRAATRPDREPAHDRYGVGLHHLAFRACSRADVDSFHNFLKCRTARILDKPSDYPAYGDPYYAVFFEDPDGIKLEFVYR